MYYLKISNYGPLIIDGSHKWNGYMPQSFKIGKQWKTLKKNERGCRSKRSTQSGNTKKKTKKTGSSDLGTSSRVYSERPQNGETK